MAVIISVLEVPKRRFVSQMHGIARNVTPNYIDAFSCEATPSRYCPGARIEIGVREATADNFTERALDGMRPAPLNYIKEHCMATHLLIKPKVPKMRQLRRELEWPAADDSISSAFASCSLASAGFQNKHQPAKLSGCFFSCIPNPAWGPSRDRLPDCT